MCRYETLIFIVSLGSRPTVGGMACAYPSRPRRHTRRSNLGSLRSGSNRGSTARLMIPTARSSYAASSASKAASTFVHKRQAIRRDVSLGCRRRQLAEQRLRLGSLSGRGEAVSEPGECHRVSGFQLGRTPEVIDRVCRPLHFKIRRTEQPMRGLETGVHVEHVLRRPDGVVVVARDIVDPAFTRGDHQAQRVDFAGTCRQCASLDGPVHGREESAV